MNIGDYGYIVNWNRKVVKVHIENEKIKDNTEWWKLYYAGISFLRPKNEVFETKEYAYKYKELLIKKGIDSLKNSFNNKEELMFHLYENYCVNDEGEVNEIKSIAMKEIIKEYFDIDIEEIERNNKQ